jgi:hypothetical protein
MQTLIDDDDAGTRTASIARKYVRVSMHANGFALAVAATGGRRRAGGISLQRWTPRGKRALVLFLLRSTTGGEQ